MGPPPIKGVEWDPTPTPNKPDMGLFGGVPLNTQNRFIGGKFPIYQQTSTKHGKEPYLTTYQGGTPPHMKKYKKLRENTSKRLSLRSKIPGVEWDPPPIDRDHREAGVGWDPHPSPL